MFENLFTPPTAEAKQELEVKKAKKKAESDVRSEFADMLANAMLESDIPDFKKEGIRLMMKAKKVFAQINEIVDTYADPVKDEDKEKAVYPVRKEVIHFLDCLEIEIAEFIALHPLPVDTRD